MSAESRYVGSIYAEAFDIFSQGEDLESGGDLSWEDLLDKTEDLSDCEPGTWTDVSAVLVVTDVSVSPSSVVTECYEDVSLDSDWEFVEPQSFSFSQKRSIVLEENRGGYEGTPVKTLPNTRRRMMPPTPQQSAHSSTDERQWQPEMKVQQSFWSTRERTVIAMMKNYLDESDGRVGSGSQGAVASDGPRRLRSQSDVHLDAGKQEG